MPAEAPVTRASGRLIAGDRSEWKARVRDWSPAPEQSLTTESEAAAPPPGECRRSYRRRIEPARGPRRLRERSSILEPESLRPPGRATPRTPYLRVAHRRAE